jgi:hypothetical protein
MALKNKIRDTQALAEFANLSADKVGRFRRIESDFVPQDWWDYQPTNDRGEPREWSIAGETRQWMQWQLNQAWLLEAWRKHFDINQFELIRLLTSVFDPNQIQVIDGWHPQPAFADLSGMPDTMYPYQRAVVFLAEQRWRARLCEVCKSPFVAGHSRQKYCGQVWSQEHETCFDRARKAQKQRDHSKHRKARNRKRRAEYAMLHASRG